MSYTTAYRDLFYDWVTGVRIKGTDGAETWFNPNKIQRKHILEDWWPITIIKKGRQAGMTTLKLLEIIFFCETFPRFSAAIACCDVTNKKSIIKQLSYILKLRGTGYRYTIRDGGVIRLENGSTITVDNKIEPRGLTFEHLLVDEACYFKYDYQQLFYSVDKDGVICVQSSENNGKWDSMYDAYFGEGVWPSVAVKALDYTKEE